MDVTNYFKEFQMGLFGNQQNNLSEKELLMQKVTTARYNMLLVAVLTLVNAVMLLAGADSYFLFSASLPYHLTILGAEFTAQTGSAIYTVLSVAFLAVSVGAYVLCFFMGKKHVGWLIAALAMFAVDTVYFLAVYMPICIAAKFSVASIVIDLIFHGYALYYFIMAVVNSFRLKKAIANEERAEAAEPVGAGEFNQPDEAAEEASYSEDQENK